MQMDDLDGISDSQAQSGNGIDPLYAKFLDQAASLGESDRQEQQQTIPAGTYYVEVTHAKGQVTTWEGKKFVKASVGVKVLEGKQAVGRYAFGDLTLTPSDVVFEGEKGSRAPRPATPKEYDDNVAAFLKLMNRVQRVLGLSQPLPSGQTDAAITSWIKPAIGRKCVIDVRAKVDKNGTDRNQFWWGSIAAADEMTYTDKEKKKAKGTALEVLRKAINKKSGADTKVGGTTLD